MGGKPNMIYNSWLRINKYSEGWGDSLKDKNSCIIC